MSTKPLVFPELTVKVLQVRREMSVGIRYPRRARCYKQVTKSFKRNLTRGLAV